MDNTLTLSFLQHWINNCKKRNFEASTASDVTITPMVKRRKIKKSSAYNLLSKDFNKSSQLHIPHCMCNRLHVR